MRVEKEHLDHAKNKLSIDNLIKVYIISVRFEKASSLLK